MCMLPRDMMVQCRTDMPAHALLNRSCQFADLHKRSSQTCWVAEADSSASHVSPHARKYFPCPGATADERKAKEQALLARSRGTW